VDRWWNDVCAIGWSVGFCSVKMPSNLQGKKRKKQLEHQRQLHQELPQRGIGRLGERSYETNGRTSRYPDAFFHGTPPSGCDTPPGDEQVRIAVDNSSLCSSSSRLRKATSRPTFGVLHPSLGRAKA
jgi:hypothetical protein